MALEAASGEIEYFRPVFLPDGVHFLYLVMGAEGSKGLYIGSLISNERTLLVPGGSNALYAQGHLLYLQGGTLVARPFDLNRLRFSGDPIPVAEQVSQGNLGATGHFTVSQTGVLAYFGAPIIRSQLKWFDRSGRELGVAGEPGDYGSVELSPDGRHAIVDVRDSTTSTRDLWQIDTVRGITWRFTSDAGDETHPRWSPDGSQVVFSSRRAGTFDPYVKAANGGTGPEERLFDDGADEFPESWSSDGLSILYTRALPTAPFDLWVRSLRGDGKPVRLLETPVNEPVARFSRDGRWVAFSSSKAGAGEVDVYVVPTGNTGGEVRISNATGYVPRWRSDGRELFFVASETRGPWSTANTLMAAEIDATGPQLRTGAVRQLFSMRPRIIPGNGDYFYDVSADGQRFLVNTLLAESAAPPMTLVVNWPALLNR
jgi:dipeptidyl aminopeptidase/acylaminoacyl peptidase